MALEFFHGFDNCSGIGDLLRYGWTASANGNIGTGRFGGAAGKSLSLGSQSVEAEGSASRQYVNFSGALSRIIGGISLKITISGNPADLSALPDAKQRVIKFMDGAADTNANCQIGIGPGPNGKLRVWRGDTLVFESAPGIYIIGVWHRLEWDLTIHGSAGSLIIKMDNVVVAGLTGLVNTQNTANASATSFRLNQSGSYSTPAINHDYDDVLIMNSVNDGNNMHSMKGDVRCDLIMPSADFQKQFTPNTGTTNWSQIDEPILSTTDYVQGIAAQEDIYDLTDPSTLSVIHAIQVIAQAYRTGTTFFNMTPKLYTNASSGLLSAMVLSGTSAPFKRVQVLNPVTGVAWTPAEINALRLGMPVT